MKLLRFPILALCLISSAMSYADGNITLTSTDEDGNTFYTYTRSGVTTGSWQSFCLPMDIDINELQAYFDKIYLPYSGEELEFYSDIDDAIGDITGGAKRKYTLRKVASSTSGITGTTENYSQETGYWTAAEEASADETRYSFAYSAEGSSFYHFYVADFTAEEEVIIPQGMPFFAHVKSDASLTDGNLSIDGHIWSDETILTGIVDKTMSVYSDQKLTTKDTSKSFHVIGSLSATDTYSGTLYTITGDGTTTSVTSTLEQYHAYIVGSDAGRILVYPTTCGDLLAMESTDAEDVLNLTDADPTLVKGTYKVGNVTYTRTISNYYASFNLPFDVDLNTMTDNFQAVYTPAGFAIYNSNASLLTTFYKKLDMTSVLPANTPILAVMTTDDSGTKKSQEVCLKSYSVTSLTSTADLEPVKMKVYDYGFNGGLATTSTTYAISYGGTLNSAEHARAEGYFSIISSNGSWGYIDGTLKAFREYIILKSLSSSSAKEVTIDFSLDDTPSAITDVLTDTTPADAIYDISGRKINSSNNSLPSGIYIKGGKKYVIK